jgi:hypothetical protein
VQLKSRANCPYLSGRKGRKPAISGNIPQSILQFTLKRSYHEIIGHRVHSLHAPMIPRFKNLKWGWKLATIFNKIGSYRLAGAVDNYIVHQLNFVIEIERPNILHLRGKSIIKTHASTSAYKLIIRTTFISWISSWIRIRVRNVFNPSCVRVFALIDEAQNLGSKISWHGPFIVMYANLLWTTPACVQVWNKWRT